MRLRRSTVYRPGSARVKRGRGFSYATTDGEPVTDDETLDRIQALVIPPAWRKERDEEKFDRVLELAARLPEVRRQIKADLAQPAPGRGGGDRTAGSWRITGRR